MKKIEFENQQPQCTPIDIQSVETQYGFSYPKELKELLLKHNGGTPVNYNRFHTSSNDYYVDYFLFDKVNYEIDFIDMEELHFIFLSPDFCTFVEHLKME